MIEIRIYRETYRTEMVDEAEGTPGTSRQFTRFNEHCLPTVRDNAMMIVDAIIDGERVGLNFTEYGFRHAGTIVNDDYVNIFWESTER